MREKIILWFFHNIGLRLFGMLYGKHIKKIINKGEFGRQHHYE